MSNWPSVSLEEISDLKRGPFGGSLKKEIFVETGFKVYEQSHVIKKDFRINRYFVNEFKYQDMKEFEVRPNDLLISCSGTLGRVYLIPSDADPGIINQALLRIRVNNNHILPVYLEHFLESQRMQDFLSGFARGTGLQNFPPMAEVRAIKIPLPPLEEQKRIAAILDQADALRKARRRAIERLNDLSQSIFYEMFGDVSKFEISSLENVADLKRGPFGGALKKEIFVEEGYKVYEQSHVIRDDFTIGRYFIEEYKFLEMKDFSIQPNDILVSCSGSLGRVAIVPEGAEEGVINQALLRIRVREHRVTSLFLKYFLESDQIQNKLQGLSHGTGLQNFPPMNEVRALQLPVPAISIQQEFSKRIITLKTIELSYDFSLRKFDALFNSLQQRAFRGELSGVREMAQL